MSRFSAAVAPEDLGDVEQPALAEDRHDRRLGGDELAQVRVVGRLVRAMPGHAERGELRALPAHRPGGGEELDVLRVRARPAALDERHAELVEHPRDPQLVGERQGDVLALRAVAQRRVVEDDRGVATASVMPARLRRRRVASASTTAVANAVRADDLEPLLRVRPPSAMSPVRHPASSTRADGRLDGVGRIVAAEREPQQHRRGQDRADRVGPVLAGDVRRRAVDRLVQAERAVGGPARRRATRTAASRATRRARRPRRTGCRRTGSRSRGRRTRRAA